MEFADFCQQQIRVIEKILKEEAEQYDKWGEVENKIDLSFNNLSDQFIRTVESKSLHDQESMEMGDVSDMAEVLAASNKQNSQVVPGVKGGKEAKDPMNTTMEVKSLALKHTDSRRHKNKAKPGTSSFMQDSREETMSDNEDSSMVMDDSHLDGPAPKKNYHKEILPKDLLKGHETEFATQAAEAEKQEQQKEEEEAINNIEKLNKQSRFKYGVLKIEDQHVKNVLDLLSRNSIFVGKVDISGQGLTDQSLLKLAKILPHPTPQIVELNLSGNLRFGTQGVSELAESVAHSHSLQVLNLGSIPCGFEAETRLVDAMCKCRTLREVDLGVFDDQGLMYFASALDKILSVRYVTIQESTLFDSNPRHGQ